MTLFCKKSVGAKRTLRMAAPWAAGAPAKICKAKFRGEKEPQRSERAGDFLQKKSPQAIHSLRRRGASDRNRTNDMGIFSPLLYQLSYRGKKMERLTRLELATSTLARWRSTR